MRPSAYNWVPSLSHPGGLVSGFEPEELKKLSEFWIQSQTEGRGEVLCWRGEDPVNVYMEVHAPSSLFDIFRKEIQEVD